MSYLVLTRKYRPQNFEEVIGQSHVTQTLMSALKNGRVGHSYIFAGPRGVGKTSVARILAKAVNCEKGIVENPCNDCEKCESITKGSSVDVIEIDGASNRGIDEIRDLREAVSYTPSSSRYKVYIIDEVHMLTKEAFNALLKTLEEPPSHVIFIFATTEPRKVPKTVLSRCQRFDFRMLTDMEIYTKLKSLVEMEGVNAEEEALMLISSRAEGSIRDAEGMLDQLISYSEGSIKVKDVKEIFGFIGDDVYIKMFDGISRRDEKTVVKEVEDIVQKGYDIQEFIIGWIKFLRKIMLYNLKVDDPTEVEKNMELEKVAKSSSPEFITAVLNLSADLERNVRSVPYSQAFLELSMLRMTKIPDIRDLDEVIKDLSKTSDKYTDVTKEVTADREKEIVKEPEDIEEFDRDDATEMWQKILNTINGADGKNFLKSFLKDAKPVSYFNKCLHLSVPAAHKEHLRDELQLLKDACKKSLGYDIEIKILSSDEPVKETLRDKPIVKKIKDIFNAEEYF